jgi:integrase
MTVRWNGKPEVVRSHLSELLDLANLTGRRLSSIRMLTYADILPDRGSSGSLRFRADVDKMGYESAVPMTVEVRAVIDRVLRDRPGIGNTPLFPSPKDLGLPVSRYLCDKWLREAEGKAGVEKLKGRLWHAYRAKFATEMVDMPDRVVAKLGGWKAVRTLDLYQQPSDDMMLEALEQRRALREVAR